MFWEQLEAESDLKTFLLYCLVVMLESLSLSYFIDVNWLEVQKQKKTKMAEYEFEKDLYYTLINSLKSDSFFILKANKI